MNDSNKRMTKRLPRLGLGVAALLLNYMVFSNLDNKTSMELPTTGITHKDVTIDDFDSNIYDGFDKRTITIYDVNGQTLSFRQEGSDLDITAVTVYDTSDREEIQTLDNLANMLRESSAKNTYEANQPQAKKLIESYQGVISRLNKRFFDLKTNYGFKL